MHDEKYGSPQILFDLKNGSSTCKQSKNNILSIAKWQFALWTLDDVVIFLKCIEDHWDYIQTFLSKVSKPCGPVKSKRGFQCSYWLLVTHVSSGRLIVSTSVAGSICSAKHRTKTTELNSCLALCNVYPFPLRSLARATALLYRQLGMEQFFYFKWLNEKEIWSLETLRNGILLPPVHA